MIATTHRPNRMARTFARTAQRGFTLVEMLVVMGIIAMILGLSVPVFAVLQQANSIKGAVDITQGAFLKYREKAAATGKPVFLVVEHWEYPIKLSAWYVEEADDVANPGNMIITFQKDPADHIFPDNVELDPTCTSAITQYAGVPGGIPYENLLTALCTDAAPGYQFNTKADPENRALIYVFMPAGAVMIIGKPNVASFSLDTEPPTNGDIVLSNEDSRLFIDVNPITGKVRWAQSFSAQ